MPLEIYHGRPTRISKDGRVPTQEEPLERVSLRGDSFVAQMRTTAP